MEELYHLTARRMYGVCLRYAGDEEDAKDILQDGYIKVFKKIEQFEGKGSLEGWIRRIIINTALEKLRNRVLTISLDEKVNSEKELYYDDLIDNMSADDLILLIRELSPKYQMVFNLYAIEGFTHKEIAGMLGISEGTSKSNLSRARNILQGKVIALQRIKKKT